MNRLLQLSILIFLASLASIPAHAQCATTGFTDGCSGAPAGTVQYPHLLDTQKVAQLNIIPGSGYTNGTYTWTASGCSGSGATGTVTVSGGALGGAASQSYTISNEGSGYTCRPTIAVPGGAGGGSGGSITPTVYQVRPAWNVPGVDYHVGIPSGTSLANPEAGGALPSGASLSGHTVNVTGCNVTLNGFDFTLHNTVVVVNVSSSNCVTTIENSKFQANSTALQTIALLTSLGTGGSFVLLQCEYDGLAVVGGTGSGFMVNDPVQGQGTVTFKYNYFHNFDSKMSQLAGSSGSPAFTEEYNLFANYGYCNSSTCSHGEAEYTYSGSGLKVDFSYNTYFLTFATTVEDLTALHATQADDVTISGTTDDHNVVLSPGPQGTCSGSNSNAYRASADMYNGQQEGGTLTGVTWTENYLDNSALFFPWYNNNISLTVGPNNIDAGGGGGCGNTTATTYPTVPIAPHTTSVTSSSVALAWTAATAGSNSLSGYHIYRNGALLASTASTTYTDNTVSSATTYYYTMAAYDSSANIGAQSQFVLAATSGSSGTVYYLAPSSLGGSDSNLGTISQPWLSPNHAVNCGDVIQMVASTGYSQANFQTFGTVACAAANNVAWLKGAANFGSTLNAGGAAGMTIRSSFWGVQGVVITNASNCTNTGPNFGGSPEHTTHYVIIANNICNGASGNGISSNSDGTGATSYGVDYYYVLGNWVYGAASTSENCYAGISLFEPVNYDNAAGTHNYIAGNLVNDSYNTMLCAGGGTMTYGGDGILFDTFDGRSGNSVTVQYPYTGQSVVTNNFLIANGGSGFNQYDNQYSPPNAVQYVEYNTAWGNQTDPNYYSYSSCGQIRMRDDAVGSANTTITKNLAMSTVGGSTANACMGTDGLYDIFVASAIGASPNFPTTVTDNATYSASSQYFNQTLATANNTSGAVVVTNEHNGALGLSAPADPGAPPSNCSGYATVPACFTAANVVANFHSSAYPAYGYQVPGSSRIDSLYPQFLCTVTNMPAGLVTPGCLSVQPAPIPHRPVIMGSFPSFILDNSYSTTFISKGAVITP